MEKTLIDVRIWQALVAQAEPCSGRRHGVRLRRRVGAMLGCARGLSAAMLVLLAACVGPGSAEGPMSTVPDLPVAVSNNAVAAIEGGDGFRLYSLLGLKSGKTWRDVSRQAFEYDSSAGRWQELPPVPVASGRLASVAAAVGGRVYLFGGYTVAANGEEQSTPEVLRFEPATRTWTRVADMPLPVDDSVALVYRDRWVLLVSGWHQDANVADVQVYDTRRDTWARATDWPGAPVFGHAGAISDEQLLVCDGVRLDVDDDGKRRFSASNQCWRGRIVDGNPAVGSPMVIEWNAVRPHPGLPRYRMGAAAIPGARSVLFAGGSTNPYNYNGIGYDGIPSEPSARMLSFDLDAGAWLELPAPAEATMDHRGLACTAHRCYLIGGMRAGQRVAASTVSIEVAPMRRRRAEP